MNDVERYNIALHAMQTGVAAWMGVDKNETDPKHLRVGINSALCDTSALAKLLIAKGLIKEEEYLKAIADMMEAEVKRYEERLSGQGVSIKLL